MIGSQWKGQGGALGALSSLLGDQKRNAAALVPSGFSLADIPGFSAAEGAVRSAERAADGAARAAGQVARRTADTAQDATSAALKWIVPLAAVLLIALGLWYFF